MLFNQFHAAVRGSWPAENPCYAINSVEGDAYYLHAGEVDGTCKAEFVGSQAAWAIEPATAENVFGFSYWEGEMDSDGRMVLDMLPFSLYK